MIICITKASTVFIDNAEDLVVAMPIYNLVEYSKNYRATTGSLWNYYRNELIDDTCGTNSPNKKVVESKPFKYKTNITGSSIDYNFDEKITDIDGNQLVILIMMQIKWAQKKLKLLFH